MDLADNQVIANTQGLFHAGGRDGEGLEHVCSDDHGCHHCEDDSIEPFASFGFLWSCGFVGILIGGVFHDEWEEDERQDSCHELLPNLEFPETLAQFNEHQEEHEDIDIREDDKKPPPEFFFFLDDFQHHVDVEIGNDGVVALLSGGFELFPTESEWDGEQGGDEKDKKDE